MVLFASQGLASVFNITLGIVSWWTSKESERYNRLIQLRVFAFCLNILHAYITGPIIYQNDDVPLMAPGRKKSSYPSNLTLSPKPNLTSQPNLFALS